MARRIQDELPFRLVHVDISADPVLTQRYGTRIPVILIDRWEYFSGKVTEQQLRAAIEKARRREPISRILSRFRGILKQG